MTTKGLNSRHDMITSSSYPNGFSGFLNLEVSSSFCCLADSFCFHIITFQQNARRKKGYCLSLRIYNSPDMISHKNNGLKSVYVLPPKPYTAYFVT